MSLYLNGYWSKKKCDIFCREILKGKERIGKKRKEKKRRGEKRKEEKRKEKASRD